VVTLRQWTEDGVVTADEVLINDFGGEPHLRLVIYRQPFRTDIYRPDEVGGWFRVFEDVQPSISFRPAIDYTINAGPAIREYQVIKQYRKPASAQYLGFGEKVGYGLGKNGRQLTYINFDNWAHNKWYGAIDANGFAQPSEDREPLYNANLFFLEYNGFPARRSVIGLLADSTGPAYVDIAASLSGIVKIGTLYDNLDLFFYFGEDTKQVLGLLTEFIGTARLKPRYVLGYHQGCYGYEKRSDIEQVAQKYRDYRIPVDGMHIDVDIQHRYRTFTVDEDRFPNIRAMFGYLRAKGFKCSTNITPIISDEGEGYHVYNEGRDNGFFIRDERSTGRNPALPGAGMYRGGVHYGADRHTRGVYADLGRRDVRNWWGNQYADLFASGLEMVWQDMTTPDMEDNPSFADWKSFPLNLLITNDSRKMYAEEDSGAREGITARTPVALARNLYAYDLVKATYHGLNHLPSREGLRNFIIARGGFTGMHRFAALWTGDNLSDWPYLRVNILQSLAGGLSGQPIVGGDIGGFGSRSDAEKWVDPELLIRWMIAGAFLPWFRNHYTRKDNAKEFQEPWAFPENRDRVPEPERWLYDAVLVISRYYIELRYRLIQLFYDAMFENTQTGLPIVRPLFVNDDHDVSLFNEKLQFNDNEWFVGRDLLVAPVIEKQSPMNQFGSRAVYLPRGSHWYCFMDNRRPLAESVVGGQELEYDAHLSMDPSHLGFHCPMYVRAGGIIPTLELEQYVGERTLTGKPANPMTVNIYPAPPDGPGSAATYDIYEDDGISRASAIRPPGPDAEAVGVDPLADNRYRLTRVSHRWLAQGQRELRLERVHDGYTPALDYLFVAILHDPGESFTGTDGAPLQGIRLNDVALPQIIGGSCDQLADLLVQSRQTAWYFNGDVKISFLKLVAPQDAETLVVQYLPS
jgi:alpha-glucosidase